MSDINANFTLIEAESLTMPMQKDFWDARQFQHCSRFQRFLLLGFVLPVKGVPKASAWRRYHARGKNMKIVERPKIEYSGGRCECGGKLIYDRGEEIIEICEDCGMVKHNTLQYELERPTNIEIT